MYNFPTRKYRKFFVERCDSPLYRRHLSPELDTPAEARALERAAASFKQAARRVDHSRKDDDSDDDDIDCLPTPEGPGIWRVGVKVSGRDLFIHILLNVCRTGGGGTFCSRSCRNATGCPRRRSFPPFAGMPSPARYTSKRLPLEMFLPGCVVLREFIVPSAGFRVLFQ